jgi:WD40 repeat protein
VKTWKAHAGQVGGVAFSPDGTRLATHGYGNTAALLWDVATGTQVAAFEAHGRSTTTLPVRVNCLAFSPCGRYFAVGAAPPLDGHGVRVWELATGEVPGAILRPPDAPYDVALTPTDPPGLLVADYYRLSHFPDALTRTEATRPQVYNRGPDRALPRCSRVLYSADRKWVATSGKSKAVIWEAATLAPKYGREHKKGPQNGPACFDPSGEVLAVAHGTKVDLWRFADPEAKPVELSGHKLPVWAVGFLHEGRTVQTASSDGTVRLWDAATGAEQHRYDFGIGKVYCAAFAPDGLTCAAGGETGQILIWDVDV